MVKHKIVFEAIEFAAKAHSGHFRKATNIPYIVHPLGAAQILIKHGCSDDLVIGAILHDTIEDTPVTAEDIQQTFGDNILRIVQGVSEPDTNDTWENRKEHTLEHLKSAPMDILLVACADKLDNMRAIHEDYKEIGDSIWSRFNRPKEKQQWYYESLAEVFIGRIDGEPSNVLFKEYKSVVADVFNSNECDEN